MDSLLLTLVLPVIAALICMALTLPGWVLLVFALASRKQAVRPPCVPSSKHPRLAVLVPAHNESTHLLPTLACLRAQLRAEDRLIVVADNCSDDTAHIARQAGATVVERHQAELCGKGYALAFGREALREDPPEVVVIVDADCVVLSQGLSCLALACANSGRPVQMLDLMQAADGAGLRTRILEFAWLVKNKLRPAGSARLGQACHLMGTGMAFPWALFANAHLAHGHVAEDMKLGIDLALAGHPPLFLESAQVVSEFPLDGKVAHQQKTRWEHGHMRAIREELPRMLRSYWRDRQSAVLVMAMDLLIPPLTLYLLMSFFLVVFLTPLAWLLPQYRGACAVAWAGALATAVALLLAWVREGRHLISVTELLQLPAYALWKLPVYLNYLLNKRSAWVRTERRS